MAASTKGKRTDSGKDQDLGLGKSLGQGEEGNWYLHPTFIPQGQSSASLCPPPTPPAFLLTALGHGTTDTPLLGLVYSEHSRRISGGMAQVLHPPPALGQKGTGRKNPNILLEGFRPMGLTLGAQ